MKTIGLIMTLMLCAGCAALGRQEHARMLTLAVEDNQACRDQGWQYPDPRYISCRMQLDNKRQHRDWMNLQIMSQSRYQNPSAVPAVLPKEIYRPLDRDRYHCRYVSENNQDYILCGETPKKG